MQFQVVGVVGCGLMGHGIAQVIATAGHRTVVYDPDPGALARGLERIHESVAALTRKQVERGKLSESEAAARAAAARDNLEPSSDIAALRECDLIIEAIVEDLAVKRRLFAELDDLCAETCVFASNTSSFSIASMADTTKRGARFVGLHFFNPVQRMPLVEVVGTRKTESGLTDELESFLTSVGKTPIVCGDSPGFVVNRLLVPFIAQALLMLDRGDATQVAIDTAMQLGAAHPMGPITLADYVGLDTTLAILEGWVERYPDEPAFVIPASLRRHVAAGRLGRKSGRGYYEWDGDRRRDD